MQVFVTGAGGCLGRVLLPLLLTDTRITAVTAHDQRPITLRHPRLTCLRGDIRNPDWLRAAAACDAIIHMAFVVIESDLRRQRRNRALATAINIGGTQNALTAAARSGGRLIHLSSASVYGSGHQPFTELAPLQPLPGFSYAQDKAAAETLVARAEARGLAAVRLRPHIILGPHAQPFLRGLLRLPFFPRLPAPPLLQAVHEQDVARAIQAALWQPLTGPFNLACADSLSFEAIQRRRHRLPIGIPPAMARWAARSAFRVLGIGPEPAWSAALDQSLVIDSNRALTELGWHRRYPCWVDILDALDRRSVE